MKKMLMFVVFVIVSMMTFAGCYTTNIFCNDSGCTGGDEQDKPCFTCDEMLHQGFDSKKNNEQGCIDSFILWNNIKSYICYPENGYGICNKECWYMFCSESSTVDDACTDCIINTQQKEINDAVIECSEDKN